MPSKLKNIDVNVEHRVATLTINRPDKLNTLSRETLDELKQAVAEILQEETVRVGIITGAGEKAFCAGADISEMAKLNSTQAKNFAETGQQIFNLIESGGKPFIAAVNGYALGGGSELALACPIRIAAENAKFAQPEVKYGFTTGFGGSQRLARAVGTARATQLCLFGDPIDAQTALDWGLVTKVVSLSELRQEAKSAAEKLASYSPIAMKSTLQALQAAADLPASQGQAYEANLFGLCFATEDMKEGTSAFFEKRKPQFRGK
jgi:enoyl-CoA hydratase